MIRDLGALGRKAVSPKILLASAATLGATFGLAWLGDDIYHQARLAYRGTFREALEVVDYLGGPMINFPVLAVAGGSLLTDNVKLQDAAWTSLQTLVYAGILGYTLKAIFGRERPEWSDDPYDFFKRSGMIPFLPEGNSSFPSGHAIAAFGILTPWVLYYPNILTYGLYVLPVGTGISRVALGKHWATDIVVGAVIGVAMGRWLTHRHQQVQEPESRLEVSIMEQGRLFSVVLHFP